MNPEISILVPVYNAEPYLEKCIESILLQTIKGFELILLNDGSTDGSGKICDEYSRKDNRIRVIHNTNQGIGATRNILLDNAKGSYIGFVDSDDYIEPTMYEVLYKNIKKADADIAQCATRFVFAEKSFANSKSEKIEKILTKQEALYKLIDNWEITCGPCDKLYRKSLFCDIRYPEHSVFEDMLTTYKLFNMCDKIAYVGRALYNYVKTSNSILRSKFEVKHLAELDAQKNMLEDIGVIYPYLKPKLESKALTAQLYICNRIITESPEMKEIYDALSREIKGKYKTIITSKFINLKVKLMVTIMKISDRLYQWAIRIMKNKIKAKAE